MMFTLSKPPISVDNVEGRYDDGVEFTASYYYAGWEDGEGVGFGTRFVDGEYEINQSPVKYGTQVGLTIHMVLSAL